MLKKTLLVLVISLFIITSPVFAAEEEKDKKQDESLQQKIVNIWNKDAAPFFRNVACSFKSDVLDKTNSWIEKNKKQPVQEASSNATNTNNTEENKEKGKCSFFEAIHKAFTGRESTK